MIDIEHIDAMSFAYSLDKLCSHFYILMLKFDWPHASTKCIVLWISPAITNVPTVLSLSCFAGSLLRSDDHVHPAGAGKVDGRWNSLKTCASGVLWARTSLLLLNTL